MLEKGSVVFGNWTVEKEIGSGAFGTVYKIKREEFGKVFYAAMKVLHIPQDKEEHKRLRSEGMDDASISTYYSQIAQDFVKEIELLSSLDGITNIVDYKDHIIETNDKMGYIIYIKMQLLTPVSNNLVNSDGGVRFMSAEEVIKLGKDMCSALAVCEKKRIIHRDIKIDNIFLSENGDYKLGDFGIARQLEATQGEMSKKGTVLYMAPEVFRGENYDKTVDIYSLGIVLYRLLNKNRAPFFPNYPAPIKFSDKEVANARRLKGDVFPDIVGISAELNAVLKKACAFNASDRYQSADELKAALEGLVIAPSVPVEVSPIVENTINDEKTESVFAPAPVAASVVAPAMEITADEATVGVFGATSIPPAAPVAPVRPAAPVAPKVPSVPVEPVAPVRPAAPVAPTVPVTPVMANAVDEATVGVFGATPIPPAVPIAPVAPAKPVTPVMANNVDEATVGMFSTIPSTAHTSVSVPVQAPVSANNFNEASAGMASSLPEDTTIKQSNSQLTEGKKKLNLKGKILIFLIVFITAVVVAGGFPPIAVVTVPLMFAIMKSSRFHVDGSSVKKGKRASKKK